MSNVLSRFRSISEMEFYKNATELRCALSGFVMQEKYIPKKWRPIFAYPTVNLLNTMMEHIIAANGIYPYSGGKLDHELLHRRKELQAQAVADCEALFDRLQFIISARRTVRFLPSPTQTASTTPSKTSGGSDGSPAIWTIPTSSTNRKNC